VGNKNGSETARRCTVLEGQRRHDSIEEPLQDAPDGPEVDEAAERKSWFKMARLI
jgi:hypothetical protein